MKTNKGISLIVLVITIIVMIILAGSIILTLSSNGIISKASEAVEKSDEATVKQISQMAWADVYADYIQGKIEEKDFSAVVKSRIQEALGENININDYGIKVTTKGVEIVEGWIQDGTVVRKGTIEREVGDLVNYDETKSGTVSVPKDVKWKILGAKDGELLILSADSIVNTPYLLGETEYSNDDALINGIDKLNKICEIYGNGIGSVGTARSITVEDVNRVTGYDPKTANYYKNELYEYGVEVTYFWDGGLEPYVTASNGATGRGNTDILSHYGDFDYFDGEKIVNVKNTGATKEQPKKIVTIKNDAYTYFPTTLTDDYNGDKKGIGKDTKAYNMLFEDEYASDGLATYWLATRCVVGGVFVGNSIMSVWGGKVDYSDMFFSCSNWNPILDGNNVRAVVSLGNDVMLKDFSEETGWNF